MAGKKQEILNAGVSILAEHGPEGLHARTVATRVGVNHAAVHYYFPKRSDLIRAVIEHAFTSFAEQRAQLVSETGPERLKAHLNMVRSYARPESGFLTIWTSCFLWAKEDDALRAELVRYLREWAFLLKLELKNAKGSNPLSDPETLVAALVGIGLLAQTMGDEFDHRAKIKKILASLS
ncbi:MAG: TetR/AcrR family transcriptional regulator [Fimbriimonadales bacterium]